MPSILNDADKDTVKRFVPKQSNKIQAVAVAKLYVAHPHPSRWTYTGIQGAIVLANDLVGNTYWLKMVDISPSHRGVIWDQEIFDTWSYNQDRTFFHTFELEECLAGLSFMDEKEAKQFKKKMDDREKNASKATRSTPFGGGSQPTQKHSRLGGLFGSRHSSSAHTPPESPQTSLPPAPSFSHSMSSMSLNGSRPPSEFPLLDAFDPLWREHFGQDLKDKGLNDDFIKENQEFIVDFLREEQQKAPMLNNTPPPPPPPSAPPTNSGDSRSSRPPPPPPPPASRNEPPVLAPTSSKKGGAPPPPAPRRSGKDDGTPAEEVSPAPAPAPPRPRFNAPPPLPDAGKFARPEPAKPPPAANRPPPTPARAPQPSAPPPESENSSHKFGVPPPFAGQRQPPPTPSRGPVPPPPPPRGNSSHPAPVPAAAPPPLPPKVPAGNAPPPLPPPSSRPVPPPPSAAPQPPPLPPPNSSAAPPPPPPPMPPPSAAGPPPPPPPPPGPPPRSMASPPPAPPPPPGMGGPPPPPPPPPNRDSGYSSGLPSADTGRSAMLGDIQKAGGIGSLKKVDRTQIRDRSAAQVGGGGDSGPPAGAVPAGGGGGPPGGMADALHAALQKRKEKVSKSDDEDDDDDW